MSERHGRILIAKAGLDGHDRGAKLVVVALRDAGLEVVYSGLHRLPDEIVKIALEEDVSVIGLSILSGAHQRIVARLQDLLRVAGAPEVTLVVGGFIPAEDVDELLRLGVSAVFGQQTKLDDIVDYMRRTIDATGRTADARR
ncbi:MAG: cobalamin B12-binding domain-containing protein [Candidatus Rokubacteria bacterium]|nr:cobalamin B12-binding domain-containing protein [Candidatus Rokubacteria bacterium]MBI3105374.1 cobalamin B12-binding domain-containing protein [Candidatus Rokubacteria bacterium]